MSNFLPPEFLDDTTPLVEKSELIRQISHGPLPKDVASQLLRQALGTLYPQLNIDPDQTTVATPQWKIVNDQVEAGPIEFQSLTFTLLRNSLFGTKANFLEGQHFLTLEPDLKNPVHLAVSIEEIAKVLNDTAPLLFIELQRQQLEFWNQKGRKMARWLELSDSLRKALNVQSVKGWDADECAMAREVFNDPDRATRQHSIRDLSAIQACLIDIDTVENDVASHLLIGGALVLRATSGKRELLVMYTIERGYESFASIEQLGDSLPARLDDPPTGRALRWQLFEPDGNVFDHMAWALVTSQLDAIDSMRSLDAPAGGAVLPETGLDTIEYARFQHLDSAIPDWLRDASTTDIQDYGRYISALGMLYREPHNKAARAEIPSLTDYAQRLMREAIIADPRAIGAASLPLDDLRIRVTSSFTADNLTLPNPLDQRIETLADFALENEAPYMATVFFIRDHPLPQWLTPAFLSSLAAQVNVGDAYPMLIKRKLIDDPVESRRQETFYCDQLRLLLPLLALEGKVKQEAGIDEHGYRYVRELLDPDSEETRSIAIYPLTLTPQHRLISASDTVANMFIISPRNARSGPCLLYRPMLDKPLLQFPSRQNLLYALHQPGELRDSLLAWLPDKTLSFEYAQSVFPVGLPSPWLVAEQLVNPLQRADRFGRVVFEREEITGNVLSALFKSNARALVDLADRQSQSNAERRWSLLKDSSWALFNAASNVLSGAVGTAVWVWQSINEIQEALDASDKGDSFIVWTSVSDILLTLGIILSHHAVLRRKTLSGKTRRWAEKEVPSKIEPGAITFNPVPLSSELAPEHYSSLEVAGAVPRRTPAALGAWLDTLKVPAIDITAENVTQVNEAPPHLYQLDDKQFAQVGDRWFQVLVNGDEQACIVDPSHPGRSGPPLTHNIKGQWFIDLRLRLRGGAGNVFSKPQVVASELRKHELDKVLETFKSQETLNETELTAMQTDIQKADSKDYDRLCEAYTQKLDTTIAGYQKVLEQLQEWRTLGGTTDYVYDLLRMSTLLQKNLALWFVIKKNQYAQATHMLSNSGHTDPLPLGTYISRIQQATDLSHEMVEKLALSGSTLEGMRAAGRAGIEQSLKIRTLTPSFTALDLKANEIGMAQELCIQEQASPMMSQARDAVGKIVVSAAHAANQVVELIKAADAPHPLQVPVEAMSRLVEAFADADQRIQELPVTYPGLVRQPRLNDLRALIAEFEQLAQDRLQALLPEPQLVRKPAERTQLAPSRQPVKVRKTRPRAPNLTDLENTTDELIKPVALTRQLPPSVLDDNGIIEAGIELNLNTREFITQTRKDALRPRRIPADMQDVFDQQALKLEHGASQVDQAMIRINKAGGTPPPIATLNLELREAARRMRQEGVEVRARLYQKRKPTQSAFKWLHENRQVEIRRDERGRIQTKGLGDVFQEYRILDKANNQAFWVAHFHYEALDSPAENPTAAHLKVSDDFLKTLAPEQQHVLSNVDPIDGVLRKLLDPDLRQLFLDLEPQTEA